jgi:hypothetical protein
MKKMLADAIVESEIFVCCLTDLYCQKVQFDDGNFCSFEFEWASSYLKRRNMILLVLEEDRKHQKNWTIRVRAEFPNHLYIDMTKWRHGEAEREVCLSRLVERIQATQK